MFKEFNRLLRTSFIAGHRGVTLLEVMVSMIIFATGLMMMIPLIVTSIKGNEFADRTTRAAHHIQAKIEKIKNTHDFTSGEDSPDGMTRTWTVENSGTRLKKITVQMTWLDEDGRQHDNTVVTYDSHN